MHGSGFSSLEGLVAAAPPRAAWLAVLGESERMCAAGGGPAGPSPGDLERVMGIEPTLAAWEAAVLPLNYTRAMPVL